ESVDTVGDVGPVRNGRHDEHHHKGINNPGVVLINEGQNSTVVQFVVLKKGYRCLCRLHMGHGGCLRHGKGRLDGLFSDDFLPDHDIAVEIQRESHDEADSHLTHNLESARKALLVLLKDLDVVVEKPDHPQADGGDGEEDDVDVVKFGEQQGW